MSKLTENILLIAKSLPEGGIFSPKEFLRLGSRAAIDQVLCRLTKNGTALRIARGMYVMPVVGKYGSHAPSSELILANIEIKTGEVFVESGATAANALGLTTQVPVQTILITSGRSKTLSFGKHVVEIQHGARWQYVLGKSNAGSAIRALGNIGPKHVSEAIPQIRKKLTTFEWESMMAVSAVLPMWMAAAIGQLESDLQEADVLGWLEAAADTEGWKGGNNG